MQSVNSPRLKALRAVAAAVLFAGGAFASVRGGAAAAPDLPQRSAQSAPGSRLGIEGKSTLHPYSIQATTIAASAAFDEPDASKSLFDALASGKMKRLEVRVPIPGLKSKEELMDKKMRAALKADKYPMIAFDLSTYEVTASTTDGHVLVQAKGALSIAGVTKETEITGEASAAGKGIEIKGSKRLLMTDYGVKPPSMVVIRTADEVTIPFDITLAPNAGD